MLGLPLLARVPGPPRERQEADALATLAEPESAEAKAFRLLAANLDLHDLRRAAPVLIVASPVESESTSTTVANLGIALARSGRRVALVDLDLRRPALHRSFDLWRPGVAEVLLGHVRLEDAVTPISLRAADATNQGVDGSEAIGGWPSAASPDELLAAAERGIRERRPDLLRDVARRIAAAPREERLEVLSAGALAADPGPLLESDLLSDLLDDMRDRAELVLVGSPPLLDRVDTGAALDIRADAVLVVVDLDIVTRPMIAELRRVLAGWPAEKLGFVLTGAEREEPYGYGRDYAHGGSLPSQQRQLA